MTVTDATPADAEALGRILSDWIDATPWMPRLHTRDQDRAFCAHLIAGGARVTRENGTPTGFLARNGDEIDALYIAASARGRGLGHRLLTDAKARSGTLTLWTFAANTGARAFYAREGFTEVTRTDGARNDEGLPDIRLNWTRPDGQTGATL